MVYLFLIFLIIISGSSFFAIKFNKKIENTFIIFILSIIFVLYIFELIGILEYGVYFIEIFAVFSLIYNILYYVKNKKKFKELIINKGLLIFTICFLVLIFMHYGRLLSVWDEFSHWGDVVKSMFTINDFSTSPNSLSAFQSYPPAMSLFQYFLVKVPNIFIEYYLYIGYHLVYFSLIIPFVCKFKKKFTTILLSILLFVLPTLLFNSFYLTIYIDGILGLFFGYLMLTIIYEKNYDKFFILNCFLSLFTIILLKDVGMFLAIVSIVTLIIKLLSEKKKEIFSKKYIIIIAITMIAIIIAKLSWNYNINLNNARVSFSGSIDFKELIKLITLQDNSYRRTVISNFISALCDRNIINTFINLDCIRLIIISLFISLITLFKNKKLRKYIYIIFGGLLTYIIGLLIIYCFKFSEYEALRLDSYERYLSIYFIGLFFIILNLIIKENEKLIPYLLMLVLLFIPYEYIYTIKTSVEQTNIVRESSINSANKIKSLIDNGKIYVISQGSNGKEYWPLRFSLRPINAANMCCWSLGEKYYEGDIWTKNYSPKQFIDILKEANYDYIFLNEIDQQFLDGYSSLFSNKKEINSNNLYFINYETNKFEVLK